MTFTTIAAFSFKQFLASPLFMFVIIIAIMYFMMIRPQRKRQKEIENFRKGLQPGQDVVTSGYRQSCKKYCKYLFHITCLNLELDSYSKVNYTLLWIVE
mgnify:CR=1 FL=1